MLKFEKHDVDKIAMLAAFICWAEEDKAMYGGHRASDVVQAFSSLTGITVADLRMVAGTIEEARKKDATGQ